MKFARMLLLMACALSLLAMAQDKGKPAAAAPDKSKPAAAEKDKKAAKPAGMPAMKPAPEMQKLVKALVGTYTTKETHDPGPFMPNGGTGTGEARYSLGPGGFSIIETYQSKSAAGGQFRGHGVIWYDAKAGGYRGVWCDNMSPACDTAGLSKWEGDKLVGSAETEIMGKKATMKDTMSNISPEGFKFDMEMSTEGGPMKHVMTIEYTRAAGKAGAKPAAEKEKK